MKNYYRVMLGEKSKYADKCLQGGFIGANFKIKEDLSPHLYESPKEFKKHYVPIWLALHPDKKRNAASMSCGMLWTIAKGIRIGDVVLCHDGSGVYHIGEVTGNYYYQENEILQHRRAVRWIGITIDRSSMSEDLKRITGAIGTVKAITHYAQEIEGYL